MNEATVRSEFTPASWVAEIASGVVASLVTVLAGVALAGVIFNGPLASAVPLGMVLILVGSAATSVMVALTSRLPTSAAVHQDMPAAVLAMISLNLSTSALANNPAAALSTMLAIAITGTLLFGITIYLLGRFQLGKLAQFIPYPVIGGFLAGTGWLLVEAAINSQTDVPLRIDRLNDLFTSEVLKFWAPAVIAGCVLFALEKRIHNSLTLPVALATLLVLFYLTAWIDGASIADLHQAGWLMGPFQAGEITRSLTELSLSLVDFRFVLSCLPALATMILLCTLDCILQLTSVEIALGKELDYNVELRKIGIANVMTACVGGNPGYTCPSTTLMAHRAGGTTRWVGLTIGLLSLAIAVTGPAIISYIPKLLLGALIILIGIEFLITWLYESRSRMNREEYAIVWLIFGTIITVGFLPGILTGVLISVGLFIFKYSRISPLKTATTLGSSRSSMERSPTEQRILSDQGQRAIILKLQGFLFFGTASFLLEDIKTRINGLSGQRSYVLIDFRDVTGIDGSAGFLFTKVKEYLIRVNSTLLISNLSLSSQRVLDKSEVTISEDGNDCVFVYPDLDYAMEWVEAEILQSAGFRPGQQPIAEQLTTLLGQSVKADKLLPYLEPLDYVPGQHVIKQGDATKDIYFIETGYLSATLQLAEGKVLRLRKFSPGSLFGEMALYRGENRSASVVADTLARLYRITPDSLARLATEDPLAEAIFHELVARVMAERIAFQNKQLMNQ